LTEEVPQIAFMFLLEMQSRDASWWWYEYADLKPKSAPRLVGLGYFFALFDCSPRFPLLAMSMGPKTSI